MRCLIVFLLLASTFVLPSRSFAHGRIARLTQVLFPQHTKSNPSDAMLVRATWGFLHRENANSPFAWTCAISVGFDETIEDPSLVELPSGERLLGTFSGLRVSDAAGCNYQDGSGMAQGAFILDVQRDPISADTVWALRSPGGEPSTILRSTDRGRNFEVVATPHDSVLIESVRISPADPNVIYASGQLRQTNNYPLGYIFVSRDGGQTFNEISIGTLQDSSKLTIAALDPSDASVLMLNAFAANREEDEDRIIRADNFGEQRSDVFRAFLVNAVVFDGASERAWIGSQGRGLARSEDGGRTFTAIDTSIKVNCLTVREFENQASELWLCLDEADMGGSAASSALMLSNDGGDTMEKIFRFSETQNILECATCDQVQLLCPSRWNDVIVDLKLPGYERFDAGMDGGSVSTEPEPNPLCDAGVRDAGRDAARRDVGLDAGSTAGKAGCGCRLIDASPSHNWPIALAALAWIVARARRRKISHLRSVQTR